MTDAAVGAGAAPVPKRPERASLGRRSLDALVHHILVTGGASSAGDLLDQVAAVADRKLFNALLAIVQLPHASMVLSHVVWERDWRRRVRPGERPLVLMFPFGPVEMVFDVSQTEPLPGAPALPVDPTPFAMSQVASAGEMVERLRAALAELGVRTVLSRQGAALAGHIERVRDAGSSSVPDPRAPDGRRQVPVRWVVQLNQSHPATEQLATLAHEAGHLFCGHVGADKGDDWPSRLDLRSVTEEVEAESVARLVFRRAAPGASLPAYLERLGAEPASPLDRGWSHVVQAADQVLACLGDLVPGADLLPALADVPRVLGRWGGGVDLRAGGPAAREVVLVDGTATETLRWTRELYDRWGAGMPRGERPWVLLVRVPQVLSEVSSYFSRAPGEDVEHDRALSDSLGALPLARLPLTVVQLTSAARGPLVTVEADPPNRRGAIVGRVLAALDTAGVTAQEAEEDPSELGSWVGDAAGLASHWEQALGWDDIYSDETWEFLGSAERLHVALSGRLELFDAGVVERLAGAITSSRPGMFEQSPTGGASPRLDTEEMVQEIEGLLW